MSFNHHALIARMGNEDGARQEFARLVAAIARMESTGVRRIREAPGDWGIDCFIGELADRQAISVWQAKFFPTEIGAPQKAQIRDSFTSALENAKREGYELSFWTLVVPISMSAPETRWWDSWRRRQLRDHGVEVRLWDLTELEHYLRMENATSIRDEFFPAFEAPKPPSIAVAALPPEIDYDDMLFVRQLREAEILELDSAREQFFNAEVLERYVTEQGVPAHADLLRSLRMGARAIWSIEFNDACNEHRLDHKLPALHGRVMRGLMELHSAERDLPLRLHVVHRLGTMHQVVEFGRAGWVRNYQEIADEHRA